MRRCAPAVRVVRKPSKGAERRRFSSVFARTSSTYLRTRRCSSFVWFLFFFCCVLFSAAFLTASAWSNIASYEHSPFRRLRINPFWGGWAPTGLYMYVQNNGHMVQFIWVCSTRFGSQPVGAFRIRAGGVGAMALPSGSSNG